LKQLWQWWKLARAQNQTTVTKFSLSKFMKRSVFCKIHNQMFGSQEK